MIPTHITIGQIRRAIEGVDNDSPLYLEYNDVELDEIFLRFDGLTIDTEDGFKLVMTVSLVSEESAALRATPVDSHLRG
jgi:hypothetical protein